MQFVDSITPQFKLVPTSYVANTGASEVTGIFTSFLNDSINTVTDTSVLMIHYLVIYLFL